MRRTGNRTSARLRPAATTIAVAAALVALLGVPAVGGADSAVVDEVHYTYTGPTSVAFDWRGAPTDLRYGPTASYGTTVTAHEPTPLPTSSAGPFQEVEITGLAPGTSYHYSIGGGPDAVFSTAPTGSFRFDVIADVGSSHDFSNVVPTQSQIAADNPAFVLMVGDLSYGSPFGAASVDQHFDDVMAWSQQAAYMPVWGNHEWESPATDDLTNYKGRFALPHAQASSSAPAPGCCGEDWSWFDAGGVRFISYPEPYASGTWNEWATQAAPIFAAAQADPSIHFIVTFGHRPAYSTGFHPGDPTLAGILNGFGDSYSKYVLNLNGHSHDYERFDPIHRVTHVTAAGGGSSLEPWSTTDARTAFRALHLEHVRVDVSDTGMRVDAICGPPTTADDMTCVQGTVIDSVTIGVNPPPPPPPPPILYVDKSNASCSDTGAGTQSQPFCSIKPAASRVVAGQTVLVGDGTYNEAVTVQSSGTSTAPVVFAAAPGASPVVTGGSNGFYMNGRSYVTVQGFTVTGTTSDGIVAKNCSNVTLRGNHVTHAGQPQSGKIAKGIKLDGTNDSVVANNVVDHNTDYGIYLLSGSTRNQIVGNHITANARVYSRAASGIRLYGAPGNTVSSNVSYANEDSGIEIYTSSSNNLVAGNVTYGNGDHGIDNYSSTGTRIVGNSVYDNVTAGINAEGGSTGVAIRNNVSVDNGIASPRTRSDIRVDAASVSGSSMDYDLVHLTTADVLLIWSSTNYTSLSAFKAATGQEQHGLQGDPKWKSAGSGDLHLTAGSPAIDSADSGASGQQAIDAEGFPRIDDPATLDSGAGPRSFDDRGAYEYQPPEPGVGDNPPAAALSVTPASGAAPLQVTADASASTDGDVTPIATYTFDFGDGTTAGPQLGATATHTYTAAGPYTVTVTVADTAGLASTADAQVTVDAPAEAPPVAALSVSPGAGAAPLQVTADASASTDVDSTPIATYSFDFGDGSAAVGPQAGASATHTYTTPGTYTVTVTVTDTLSQSTTKTAQVDVAPPSSIAFRAKAVSSKTTGATSLKMTLPGGVQRGDLLVAFLQFGDPVTGIGGLTGWTAFQWSPVADGTAGVLAGYYRVASGTDSAPTVTWTTKTKPIFEVLAYSGVNPASPIAGSGGRVDGDGNATVTTPSVNDAGVGVEWAVALSCMRTTSSAQASFGFSPDAALTERSDDNIGAANSSAWLMCETADSAGSVAAGAHQYAAQWAGTSPTTHAYAALVYIASQPQTPVDSPPAAALSVSPSTGPAPLQVTADASASTDVDATPIATYTFDFGDGTVVGPQAAATASHTYPGAGSYPVQVTVTDTASQSSTATAQVAVGDASPAASLTVTPSSGTPPLQVTADASASTDADTTPIATYSFDFGDGSPATGPQAGATAQHTYSALGTYTVTVTVTDTANNSSTATKTVAVSAPVDAPPAAALSVSPSSGTAPLQVTADASASTDTDSTPIATYGFDFGDGSAPVGPQAGATATHSYTTPGTYTVTVTVTDTASQSSTATRQVTVHGTSSIAFRSQAVSKRTTGGTSLQLALPAGVQAGDVLVAFLQFGDPVSGLGGLTGWTPLWSPVTDGTAGVLAGYYRVASGSDTAPTVTWTTNAKPIFEVVAYSGVDQVAPVVASNAGLDADGNVNVTTPQVSDTGSGAEWAVTVSCMRVTSISQNAFGFTPDPRLVERSDDTIATAGSSPWLMCETADSGGTVAAGDHQYTAIWAGSAPTAHAYAGLVYLAPAP